MAKTIVILGITGNQGGAVASTFLSQGWNIIGITRSLTSPAALALKTKGISLIKADLDEPSTLSPAFQSAHVIFAVTDFWAPFMASYSELQKKSDRATGEYAMDLEIRRGKSIVDAAAQALREGGILERFVWSTLPNFKDLSGGKFTYAYHFDGKATITEYLKETKDLWERSSLLNMGIFVSNFVHMGEVVGFGKDKETNTYVMRKPGGDSAIHPLVDTRDTGVFVDLLVRSPPKQDLLGASEMASYATFMKILSEVSGEKCETREISIEEADKALPGGLGREAAESMATSAEFGWGKHLVLPQDLDPEVKLTSLREYIEGEDWSTVFGKA